MSRRRLSMTIRLATGFGIVIALLAVVAGTSLWRLRAFNHTVDEFASARVPKLIAAAGGVEALLLTARQMRDVLILDAEKEIKEALVAVRKSVGDGKALVDKLSTLAATAEERKLLQAIVDARAAYVPHEEEFLKIAERNDLATAKDVMLERVRPAQHKYLAAISAFSDSQVQQSARDAREAASAYTTAATLIGALAGLAVVCGIGAAVLIIRSLVTELRQAVDVLAAVAAGDFTRTLPVQSTDEMGRLAASLNQAVDAMRAALREMGAVSEQTASASHQLSTASKQLSLGAQAQAASLEETAASLEEITGTVKQTADNARQAKNLAAGSREVAAKGGQVVEQAVRSMVEINRSSKKIADIITTVDEIAFRTNLLALNAAVEAARAGEQGRGFAVVAAEVRNLAQRSAAAAKDIKTLIDDSVQKVEAGSQLVNRSGETLKEIVGSTQRVTDIIGEIAAATQEQSLGIDQVNGAVGQMDQVTQTNAARSQELSSTAEALDSQARQLQGLVARFNVGTDAAGNGAAPAAGVRSRPAKARQPPAAVPAGHA
jgi:methyl-accepting chemotaxis protein